MLLHWRADTGLLEMDSYFSNLPPSNVPPRVRAEYLAKVPGDRDIKALLREIYYQTRVPSSPLLSVCMCIVVLIDHVFSLRNHGVRRLVVGRAGATWN